VDFAGYGACVRDGWLSLPELRSFIGTLY
jgi:hypothetical protein